jgi:hypothetical protein
MWAYWQTIFTDIGRVPLKVNLFVLTNFLNEYSILFAIAVFFFHITVDVTVPSRGTQSIVKINWH